MGDLHPACPKRGKVVEHEHVPEVGHGVVLQSGWSRGDPVPRRFIGGVRWEKEKHLLIVAYRCPGGGFIELHAPST